MSFITVFALITISLLGCLIIYIFNPLAGFYFLIGIRVLAEQVEYMDLKGNTSILLGLYGVLIILLAVFNTLFKKGFKFKIAAILPYYFFVFVTLLSLGFSDDMFSAVKMLTKLVCLPAIFLMAYNLIDSEVKVINSLRYLVYAAIIPITYGFYQLATGTGQHLTNFWGQSEHRIFSTFSHANQFAFFLAMIAMALIVLIQQTPKKRIPLFISLGVVLLAILFTFSRSVWLTLTVCIFIISIFYKKLRVPVLIITIGFILLLSPIIIQGMSNIVDKQKGQQNSLDFRISMTTQLFEKAFPERPLLGFGPGSAEMVVAKYTRFGHIVPHNDYIRILIEFGAVGLLSFLFFLFINFLIIVKDIKQIGRNNYFTAIFIMFLFLSTILVATNHIGNISTSGIWFLLLGILYKGNKLQMESEKCEN
jgi:O-antigen ligase